ncbi:MAG: hypothetical protein JWQ33_2305 [Ramlibacter sp.]|nr:hypothetical protein [Ramlibacter sp.]
MPAPYEVLVGSPEIAMQFERFSTALWSGAVSALISETIFLITAKHFRCAYQWETHKAKALDAGLRPEIIRAIGQGEPLDELCVDQRAVLDVYRFLRALHFDFAVSDGDFDRFAAHFDEVQLSELMAFCGFAVSIAMLLNVRQVAPPASWSGAFN